MNLILASSNLHKSEEFNILFKNSSIVISPSSSKLDVVEDGSSYFENALIKAKAYYDHFKQPVLADDSGLTVESLSGELGIHSARFGGAGLSDKDRAELLLQKLEMKHNREAYFTCVLCFYLNPKEIFYFEGRLNGVISTYYQAGSSGFGYDPVFIPEAKLSENMSVSELGDWKDTHSHRAIAASLALKFFDQRI